MKNYIIVYDYDKIYYTCGETQIDIILNLFEFWGGSTQWTSEELKVIGKEFGFEKLISLFQNEHYKIELIAEYSPIFDNRKITC